FIPIYGDFYWIKPGFSTFLYYLLIVLECTVITYNIVAASFGIDIIRKSSLFHRNMLNLGILFLVNSYFHATSRSILLFVQLKVLLPDESQFATAGNITIMIASIMRCYQGISAITLFGSIVIERLFATVYLYDYEQRKRPWISNGLIFSTVCLSIMMGLSRTFQSYNTLKFWTVTYVRYCTFNYIILKIGVSLVFYNHRRVSRILLSPRYSLGAKFQLKENMKAFKFLLFIVVWSVAGFAVAGSVAIYR
ncbi:hypothetical protein PENTCL1PPCAC_19099, partial [Pristionchus entomophagus]